MPLIPTVKIVQKNTKYKIGRITVVLHLLTITDEAVQRIPNTGITCMKNLRRRRQPGNQSNGIRSSKPFEMSKNLLFVIELPSFLHG